MLPATCETSIPLVLVATGLVALGALQLRERRRA